MKLDEFESVFRSAVKAQFQHAPPELERILLVTDLKEAKTQELLTATKSFFRKSHDVDAVEWMSMHKGSFSGVSEVLDRVRRNPPSMVVCYRHLLGQGAGLPYSLGSTVDTLTQATDVPVLLLPRPDESGIVALPSATHKVMVVTDHLTGDDQLVNWAVHMCADEGKLYLCHVEDKEVLDKYLDVCSKLPGIDQNVALHKIPDKLLSMPSDYIETIARELAEHSIHEQVEGIVKLGHPVQEYQQLVKEHAVDLLVMNTKDKGQSAMHPLAYALSVDIRDIPLLLL